MQNQLEFPQLIEIPFPDSYHSLEDFASYVKARARDSHFSEHTEWLEQWKSLCLFEWAPQVLRLERLDKQDWQPVAVATYGRAFFPGCEIVEVAMKTASGVKKHRRIVELTTAENFENLKSLFVQVGGVIDA